MKLLVIIAMSLFSFNAYSLTIEPEQKCSDAHSKLEISGYFSSNHVELSNEDIKDIVLLDSLDFEFPISGMRYLSEHEIDGAIVKLYLVKYFDVSIDEYNKHMKTNDPSEIILPKLEWKEISVAMLCKTL